VLPDLSPPANPQFPSHVPVRRQTNPRLRYDCPDILCAVQRITFADKITLGQSAVLGIMCVNSFRPVSCALICRRASKSNHLSVNQFNWLGTIFSLSYLAFEYPQNLALQRFPVGKWMRFVSRALSNCFEADRQTSINIFIWSIALLCHAACESFGGLFAVRFILGMCEGAITPGFMIVCATLLYTSFPATNTVSPKVTSMFYTRTEQMQRTGYWCMSLFFYQSSLIQF